MKLPSFNPLHAVRDSDGRPRIDFYAGLFSLYQTGDFTINYAFVDLHLRRVYNEFNLALTYPRDKMFKFATPDGRAVSNVWLICYGAQPLVVDLDKKKAWALGRSGLRTVPSVPVYARYSAIYFPDAEADPITNYDIRLVRPSEELRKARKWKQAVQAAAMAIVRINGVDKPPYNDPVALHPADVEAPPEEYITKVDSFTLSCIAYCGFKSAREIINVPYLLVC